MTSDGSKPPKGYCKDCWSEWVATQVEGADVTMPPRQRPLAEGGGGRCATHWREEKKRRKAASHERRAKSVYGLEDYWGLYRHQGGHCAICHRATGATRRLSIDHDHATGKVRGLLCRPCNTLLGQARDDERFFLRCITYLRQPPYDSFLLNKEAGDYDNSAPASAEGAESVSESAPEGSGASDPAAAGTEAYAPPVQGQGTTDPWARQFDSESGRYPDDWAGWRPDPRAGR